MSSPDNKNSKTSGEKTIDNHKLVYNMTAADEMPDEMPDDKNLRGDDVDSMIGGEDADDVNIDDDADNKKTVVAGKKETYSADAEITLDPVSKAGLLSGCDAQTPKHHLFLLLARRALQVTVHIWMNTMLLRMM
jgi:hypothetical protein